MASIKHNEIITSNNDNQSQDVARVTAEVQSSVIVARKFPRDESQAISRVMQSCKRKTLAEQAAYSYSKGGADVTGPSIRLAEEIARNWGNIQYGIREISKDVEKTVYEVFCWDLETNVRINRIFSQKHIRETRKGNKHLTDSRDVYEIVASNAARRLRAVILEVLPSYIVEDALKACEDTLKKDSGDDKSKIIESIKSKFLTFNVDQEMIEARIGRKLEAITQQQIIELGKIYQSLFDGMSSTEQWFGQVEETENIREKVKSKTKGE